MEEPRTIPDCLRHWAAQDPDTPAFIFRQKDGGRYVLTRADVLGHSQRFSWRLRSLGLGAGHVVCNTLVNSPERVVTDFGTVLAGALPAAGHPFLADGSDLRHTLGLARASALLVDPDVPGATWSLCQRIMAASSPASASLATVSKDAATGGENGSGESSTAAENNAETSKLEKTSSDKELLEEKSAGNSGGDAGKTDVPGLEVVKVSDPELPALTTLLLVRRGNDGHVALWDALAKESPMPAVDLSPDSTAVLFCTSGTTGFSKLVATTHQAIIGSGDTYHEEWLQRLISTGRFYNDEMLGWVSGWPHFYVCYGVTQVLQDVRSGGSDDSLADMWKAFVEEKCDYALVAPYVPSLLAARQELWKESAHRPRALFTGGAPPSPASLQVLGGPTQCLVQVYGNSEANIMAYQVFQAGQQDRTHTFLAGTLTLGVQARVVDEDLNDVSAGQSGEILIRSPRLCQGYYNQPDKTAAAFTQDGWFRTDDQGYFDQQGRLNVMGRRGDVIMRGGYKIHPAWLEVQLGKVTGVKAVAVVAVPDPDQYEEMCACVEPLPGSGLDEEKLRSSCEDLVDSQLDDDVVGPRYFLLMKALPRTGRGKLDRRALRARAAASLGRAPSGGDSA